MQRARRQLSGLYRQYSEAKARHAALLADDYDVLIYTDGSGIGSDGLGGWGVVCVDPYLTMSGKALRCGSYGAEVEALIRGMRLGARLHELGYGKVRIRADNQACVFGVTEWLPKWQMNKWQGHNNAPIAQVERWQRVLIILEANPGVFSFEWVKGHSGDPHNEAADKLAGMERNRAKGCSE